LEKLDENFTYRQIFCHTITRLLHKVLFFFRVNSIEISQNLSHLILKFELNKVMSNKAPVTATPRKELNIPMYSFI